MTTAPAAPLLDEAAIAARAHALDLDDEGIIGLIPARELYALAGVYLTGLALLGLGVRLSYAAGRDTAAGITARLTGS